MLLATDRGVLLCRGATPRIAIPRVPPSGCLARELTDVEVEFNAVSLGTPTWKFPRTTLSRLLVSRYHGRRPSVPMLSRSILLGEHNFFKFSQLGIATYASKFYLMTSRMADQFSLPVKNSSGLFLRGVRTRSRHERSLQLCHPLH